MARVAAVATREPEYDPERRGIAVLIRVDRPPTPPRYHAGRETVPSVTQEGTS